ncbi:CRISPR-associated helicase, Cas3 family [Thalassoporum mexicanum PCC 7367]|uniref:CRISPR-associated helicase/endonuclease Cas3 n=1 Tax=Thalassoporum mexicanum TaxID=3457544 RepID=UPI00029F8D9C|nr:CRISPR-associated helicase/endonuclease Cas3 [Pseudanabaena sp. PCC 7367]AFY70022.1 CRISPR-associated helicase, Cas3 family [Pseudanabaena sp. PCC 7367]
MQKLQYVAHTPNKLGEWHSLQEHLSDVAIKAQGYAAKIGCDELGYYAGLWHDLGKYHPKFQQYLECCHLATENGRSSSCKKFPHAIYGACLAREYLQPLAPIIWGHHAGLPDKDKLTNDLSKENHAVQNEYRAVLQHVPETLLQVRSIQKSKQAMQGLAKDSTEMLIRMLFSCLVDADYLDTEEHFDPDAPKLRGGYKTVNLLWKIFQADQQQLFDRVKGIDSKVNQIRSEVYLACVEAAAQMPGVFRLAVPTGGGKTRSGLAFALKHAMIHNLDRVIVAVPYTSIIEQTVNVYRNILGEADVLEHHSAAKEPDDEDARQSYAKARLATQNWDASLVVTTTVQLFESLFANRPSRCRKLHNLVGSVIVLDEVQTLPMFLLTPILSGLKELVDRYRVTVVLCTATQPALEGESRYLEGFTAGSVRDIVSSALAKQHFAGLARVNYEIKEQTWSWEQLVADIKEHNHDRALIILNTRKDALAVLDTLQNDDEIDADSLLHLSTLLCGEHRRQVLNQVRNRLDRHQPCLLVSTQVVEAGVDLDFPAVYRAIGPLDRIVQAAGRCNREGKMPEKGRVVVFEPEQGSKPKGDYETAAKRAEGILKSPELDLHNPDTFETYFKVLYKDVKLDQLDIQKKRTNFNYPEVAKNFKFIKDDTTPVVIQFDDRVRKHLKQIQRRDLNSGDYRKLQPYLVNLRQNDFKGTEALREEIAPGLWVWERLSYDELKGIKIGDRSIDFDPADLVQ